MTNYFFEVKNGHSLVDPSGLDCADDGDAIDKATIIARQITEDVGKSSVGKVVVIDVTPGRN